MVFFVLENPGPSLNLTVKSVTATSIYLQWIAPTNNFGINSTFYKIYYQNLNKSMSSKSTSSATKFSLTGLIPVSKYVIHVTAANKYFEGDPSNQISQTTRAASEYKN